MRRRWWVLLGLAVVIGAGVLAFLFRPVNGPPRDLTLTANLENGEYLIRLGGCVACHTDSKAQTPTFGGGAPLVTAFGTFIPPNISSDRNAGIGSWSVEQFSAAMSDGEGPQGHLYPAFPYDSYTLMSDQEVVDLYAALMQTDPVPTPADAHQIAFPFNQRLLMGAWKSLFFHPGRFAPDPSKSEAWNRGAYLVNGPGHCVTCHTPRNIFGARDDGRALMGSQGGPGGNVPAIDKATLLADGWDEAILADVLNGGIDPNFDVPGGTMNEVITESTKYWTPEDRAAVATYLLGEETP